MTRRFTGRHMLMIMFAFFGTVIAVNLTMATYAASTFGGTVVDNSYVASQRFNGWLDEARAQDRIGWTIDAELDPSRRILLTASGRDSRPIEGAMASVIARHPVGRAPDLHLVLRPIGGGRYRSAAPLPEGRWRVHFELARGSDRVRRIEDIR